MFLTNSEPLQKYFPKDKFNVHAVVEDCKVLIEKNVGDIKNGIDKFLRENDFEQEKCFEIQILYSNICELDKILGKEFKPASLESKEVKEKFMKVIRDISTNSIKNKLDPEFISDSIVKIKNFGAFGDEIKVESNKLIDKTL